MDNAAIIAAARAGTPQVVSDRWLNEHEATDAFRGLVTVPNPQRVGILDAYLLCTPEHDAAVRRREQLGVPRKSARRLCP